MSDPTKVSRRRLVAVFAADVEGYSRLMGADEVGTLKGLTERRAILDRLIGEHRGRIANTAGDSVLAEFGSAVDAVQCAVDAQTALAEANARLAPDRHISFRIGIHVGDVMVRGGDLFGDGVNIAARLQTFANAGTVCISGATYDQVRKVLPMTFVDFGVQRVKNIEEPVRAYQVGSPSAERDVPARAADTENPPTLDKPSIAVLPFQNMSGDPEQEYFADGIAEDVLTTLSKIQELMVNAQARSEFERALAINPVYAPSLSLLGFTLTDQVRFGWRKDETTTYEAAVECATRALAADPESDEAYVALGYARLFQRRHDDAVAAGEKAIAPRRQQRGHVSYGSYVSRLFWRLPEIRRVRTADETTEPAWPQREYSGRSAGKISPRGSCRGTRHCLARFDRETAMADRANGPCGCALEPRQRG
jgi:class 3 adenylate cyclase